VQARLLELGVKIITAHGMTEIGTGAVQAACVFTGRRMSVEADATVLVTARLPHNGLLKDVKALAMAGASLKSITVIGDAEAPGTIAAAVFAGRRYAEELEVARDEDAPLFRREVTGLAEGPLPWRTPG
jgi:dimethylamine/trimethylamine dehydrogenase